MSTGELFVLQYFRSGIPAYVCLFHLLWYEMKDRGVTMVFLPGQVFVLELVAFVNESVLENIFDVQILCACLDG